MLLHGRKLLGEISAYRFEPYWFGLANDCRYKPDFEVVMPDGGIEYHEVKGGYVREDGKIKFKVAGQMYPEYRWVWAQWIDGVWKIKTYEPVALERMRVGRAKT